MKNANGYGSITKLSGSRRRPYVVRITTSREIIDGKAKQNRKILGYYATRKEAMMALAEYNKNPYDLDANAVTLEEVWENARKRARVSDARKKKYDGLWKNYLEPLSKRTIKSITSDELQNVIDNCKYGYSTKVGIKTILKHIYSYAMEKDIVAKDQTQFIKIENEGTQLQRQIYSGEEIKELWEHKDEDFYRFTLILLYQGMRLTELRDLPKGNVDLIAGTISITEAKNKQSVRIIPIHSKVFDLIKESISVSDTDKVFNFNKNQYEYFAKNNLNHLPYDTRHTFASKSSSVGIENVIIQRLMGHKPSSVLEQHYIHLTIDELKTELDKISY